METQVYNIFPTTVWKTRLQNFNDINSLIESNIQKLMLAENRQKNVKWQSQRNLNELDFMKDLNEQVLLFCHSILKKIDINYDKIKITGAWANVSPPGSGHKAHTHPNNFISGVYYAKAKKGADTINFLDPRMVVGLIRPPVNNRNQYNSESVSLIVEPGDLCFFPHWLRHSVNPNKSSEDRISIAFNVMFDDYVNTMSKPMW